MNIEHIKPRTEPLRIFLTLLLVGIAFGLRIAILPVDGRVIFSTFYPAIGIAALLCGYRYGLLSLGLSGLLAYWFLLLPTEEWKPLETEQLIGLSTFLFAGLIICLSFTRISGNSNSLVLKPTSMVGKVIYMLFMIAFAFLLRITLLPMESRVIYSTFYPVIAVITLACGFRVGLLAIATSSFVAYLCLLPPFYNFKSIGFEQATGLVTFVFAAGIICFSLREVIIRGQKIKQVNDALQDLMTTNTVGKTLEDLVQVIASTIDMRDPYTAGHQRRVSELAVAIGKKLDLPERELMGIKLAGLIHDLGKMSVPLEILTKPGKLSQLEMDMIREHPKTAYNTLKDIRSPWPLADIVFQHHERMDGSGYPNHLAGEEILLEARILAVADVVEAMSAMRPYRESLGVDAAMAEISKYAGTRYDENVVDACRELFDSGEFKWSSTTAK